MEKLKNIVRFLDRLLDIKNIKDDSWNGLQWEGKQDVKKIMCTVDAGASVFEKAVEENADLIIVHHGIYWKNTNPSFTGANKKRMELLCKNGISLYAAHLPLDMHPEIGNNVLLLKIIGARRSKPFFPYNGQSISYCGIFTKKTRIEDIVNKLNDLPGIRCRVLPYGRQDIKTVAVISGGGGYAGFNEAIKEEVDLYISGDTLEVFHLAKDSGMNVIFGGHHATETLGVKEIAGIVEKKFNVVARFIDVPTGL
ncbi:MAG: Nif3-like dinuclear metal center hexameric protein [Candidatus Omnitrophica bacterium]|nr:Nif3-like dinuclear metal center hexameric protein [Candidatus Omnitrophota bacterium]MCM8827903.1 Nif3-like dinuclear metal center hexameric protein [Candidatus Omnitrophota bacterium]